MQALRSASKIGQRLQVEGGKKEVTQKLKGKKRSGIMGT
jgi:hypothetical protein